MLLVATALAAVLSGCAGQDEPAVSIRVNASGELTLPGGDSNWLMALDTVDVSGTTLTIFATTNENSRRHIHARRFDSARGMWTAWEAVGVPAAGASANSPSAVALSDGSILLTWIDVGGTSQRRTLRSRRWNPVDRSWQAPLVLDADFQPVFATAFARANGEAVAVWLRDPANARQTLVWSRLVPEDAAWSDAQTLVGPAPSIDAKFSEDSGNIAVAWAETAPGAPLVRGVPATSLSLRRLAVAETSWSDRTTLSANGRSAGNFVLREVAGGAAVLWLDASDSDGCLNVLLASGSTASRQTLACGSPDAPVMGGMSLHPRGAQGVTALWMNGTQPWSSTVGSPTARWSAAGQSWNAALTRWQVADGNSGPVLLAFSEPSTARIIEQSANGVWTLRSEFSFGSFNSDFRSVVSANGRTAVVYADVLDSATTLRASADIGRLPIVGLGGGASALIAAEASANGAGRLAVLSNAASPATTGLFLDVNANGSTTWANRVRVGDSGGVMQIDTPRWLGSSNGLLLTWTRQADPLVPATRAWSWGR